MTIGVPVLRDAFDPWRSKDHDEDDGCEGCRKMDEGQSDEQLARFASHHRDRQ